MGTQASKNLVAASLNLKKGMENMGMNTWINIKRTGKAAITCVAGAAKATYTYGGVIIAAHPYVAGTAVAGGLCYGGYRLYRNDVAERTALSLKQSIQKL
jgi:hypothetical protein